MLYTAANIYTYIPFTDGKESLLYAQKSLTRRSDFYPRYGCARVDELSNDDCGFLIGVYTPCFAIKGTLTTYSTILMEFVFVIVSIVVLTLSFVSCPSELLGILIYYERRQLQSIDL